MTEQKSVTSEAVASWLNENENAVDDPSVGDTFTVLGVELTYSEDSHMHSDEVSGALSNKDIYVTRTGRKEISYGSWVDTHWLGDWEA